MGKKKVTKSHVTKGPDLNAVKVSVENGIKKKKGNDISIPNPEIALGNGCPKEDLKNGANKEDAGMNVKVSLKNKKKRKRKVGGTIISDAETEPNMPKKRKVAPDVPSTETIKKMREDTSPSTPSTQGSKGNAILTGGKKLNRNAKKRLQKKAKRELQRKAKLNLANGTISAEAMVTNLDGMDTTSTHLSSVNMEQVSNGTSEIEGAGQRKKKRAKRRKKMEVATPLPSSMEVDNKTDTNDEKVDVASHTIHSTLAAKTQMPLKKDQTADKSQQSKDKYVVPACAILNDKYSLQQNKEEITTCWRGSSSLISEGFEVLGNPFKCARLPHFLTNSTFLKKVAEELSTVKLQEKNNDLYKFQQTCDLKGVESPYIAALKNFLYGDFRNWLADVTGIQLNSTVDMGSSQYTHSDVLLCHDDELEGRRIAYILYLTPPWYEGYGGMLDLFDVDANGQPRDVVHSIQPEWNTFAFFEVSPVSFHQVREVLAKNKVRLSINGWFHGPNIERPPKHVNPPRPLHRPVYLEEDELYSWINPSYLDSKTQKEIRKKFQNDSEIELESFLCDEKYKDLLKALGSKQLKWRGTGPANKQSCNVLNLKEKLPDIIMECCKFLKSEALFLILSQLTGLKLHRLAPPDSDPDSDEDEEMTKDSEPGMTVDIRKWNHGCYTLLRDSDVADKCSALDATLFFGVSDDWKLDYGGFTSYIAKDEDEELLTVVPRTNCLALVYRDAETLKFTKYINAGTKQLKDNDRVFYDFSCVYKE